MNAAALNLNRAIAPRGCGLLLRLSRFAWAKLLCKFPRHVRVFAKGARKTASVALMCLVVQQAHALDTNIYFQFAPRDMDPNAEGIQWVRGASYSNQFDVLMWVGTDFSSDLQISAIQFNYGPWTNANSFVSAYTPYSVGAIDDIFYDAEIGGGMFIDKVYSLPAPTGQRQISLGSPSPYGNQFTATNLGRFGIVWEQVGSSVPLGSQTKVANVITNFTSFKVLVDVTTVRLSFDRRRFHSGKIGTSWLS